MTLQETLQILGGIGVITSMIYVGIQIRKNAQAMRASTYQQLSTNMMQAWASLANNGETTDILLRGMDDFSPLNRLERARFRFLTMSYFKMFENAWFQLNIGTLREKDWKAISTDMQSVLSTPGAHSVWPLINNRFNSDFATHVDEIIRRQAETVVNYKQPLITPVKTKPRQNKSTKA